MPNLIISIYFIVQYRNVMRYLTMFFLHTGFRCGRGQD